MGASASPCHLVQLLCTALYTLSEFYVKRVSLLESATKTVVSNCANYCNFKMEYCLFYTQLTYLPFSCCPSNTNKVY